jgi:hypothetical protein
MPLELTYTTRSLIKDVKDDTQQILGSTGNIKQDTAQLKMDTAQILAEIARLRTQLPPESQGATPNIMLERYLDNLTSYAESVIAHEVPSPIQTSALDFEDFENTSPMGESDHEPTFPESAEPTSYVDSSHPTPRIRTSEPRLIALSSDDSRRIQESLASASNEPEAVPQANNIQDQWQNTPPREYQLHLRPTAPLQTLLQSQSDQDPSPAAEQDSAPPHTPHMHTFHGNYVLDLPIPEDILNQVPHVKPPERDEFTHQRYNAVTCAPRNFAAERYILRTKLFGRPRTTELMVAIDASREYYHDNVLWFEVASCLQSVIEELEHLVTIPDFSPIGAASWKVIVVCIFVEGTRLEADRSWLHRMGLGVQPAYPMGFTNDDGERSGSFDDGQSHPPQIFGENIIAQLYEVRITLRLSSAYGYRSLAKHKDADLQCSTPRSLAFKSHCIAI